MSRIRSIHPGLFTDEAFVCLSPMARILLMGIWTECDDDGIFEWSPLKLKMRVLPADNADASGLLEEMLSANVVMRFDAEGKAYGAVRNFCQYQRPQKPKAVHPKSEAVRDFINMKAREKRDGTGAVQDEYDTPTVIPRQMKEEGGRRETLSGKPEESKARKRADTPAQMIVPDWIPQEAWKAFVEMRRAMPKIPFTVKAAKGIVDDLEAFRAAGHNVEAILLKSVKLGYRGVFAPDKPEGAAPAAAAPMNEADRVAYLAKLQSAPHLRGNQTEGLAQRNPTHGGRGATPIGELAMRLTEHAA